MILERVPPALALPGAMGEGVDLAVLEGFGAIDLWISAADPEARARAGAAAGLDLPTTPRTQAATAGMSAVWLSPDHWLLLGRQAAIDGLEIKLHAVLAGRRAAATQTGDGWAGFILSGPDAEAVLMRASASDLTRIAAKAGLARMFLLGQAKTLLRVRETGVAFAAELWTERSCAAYAVALLRAASRSPHDLPLWGAATPPMV